LGLLAALVPANVAFLILHRTAGPAIGALFYLVLLILAWGRRQGHRRIVIVGGLVGLAVHVGEVMASGWPAEPLLLVLNMILPVLLVVAPGWPIGQRSRQEGVARAVE
jgi:hypothetical protein